MSNTKKFLDQEGVKYLWSKVNMQDYPNNETLINVINAIDETKADKDALNTHIENKEVHLSAGERDVWNNKQDNISGNPGEYVVIDKNGNITTQSPKALLMIDVITEQQYLLQIRNGQIVIIATSNSTSLLGEGLLGDFILGE